MLLLLRSTTSPSGEALSPDLHRFVLRNGAAIGGQNLLIGSVTLEADNGTTAFAIVSDTASGASIPPGATREVIVRFSPTAIGTHTGRLRIPSSDPDGVAFEELTGPAVVAKIPVIAVDPITTIAFGSLAVAGDKPTATVNVSNSGNGDLTVGTITLTTGTQWAITSDGASGQVIEPGGSRSVLLTFSPTTTGAKTDNLNIPSDGGSTVVVPLTGTGARTVALFPTSWNAGSVTVGDSETLTAIVTASGTLSVTVGTVAVTGTGFAKGTDAASSATIQPGHSANVAVRFAPGSSGSKTGSLSVPSNTTTATAALSGMGVLEVVTPPPPPVPPDATVDVSRFYLSRQAAPSGVTVPNSAWSVHTVDANNLLGITRAGPTPAWGTTTNAGLTTNETTRLARYISPPLAEQALNTTFTAYCTAAYRSDLLGYLITSAVRFGVWHASNGSITWGYIKADTAPTDPWPTAADPLPRRMPAGRDGTWSVGFSTLDGDRLILEVGCRRCAGGPTAGVRMRWGGSSTDTDLADTQAAQPLTRASWIDFAVAVKVKA